MRYLNSISDKYEHQYANWLEKGVVSANDAFVIALNPRKIPFDYADTDPPRILQAGYTVGTPYIVIDRQTAKAVGSGYHFFAIPSRRHRARKSRPVSRSRISSIARGPKLNFFLALKRRPLTPDHVLDHEAIVLEHVNKCTSGERSVV